MRVRAPGYATTYTDSCRDWDVIDFHVEGRRLGKRVVSLGSPETHGRVFTHRDELRVDWFGFGARGVEHYTLMMQFRTARAITVTQSWAAARPKVDRWSAGRVSVLNSPTTRVDAVRDQGFAKILHGALAADPPLDRPLLLRVVGSCVATAKKLGWTPEHVIAVLKRAARDAGLAVWPKLPFQPPFVTSDPFLVNLVSWTVRRYFSEGGAER